MFRTLLLIALVAALIPAASAAERLPGPIPASVLRVVDGDTVEVTAQIWLGQQVKVAVRLAGIDTPELRGACVREQQLAQEARALLRREASDAAVTLYDVQTDKYGGRVRAEVRDAQGVSLADHLIAAGLARPYDGGRRAPWCNAR